MINKRKLKNNIAGYAFISPLIIYFLVFQLLPMVMAFVISFSKWNMRSDIQWVGFDNYIQLFTDRLAYPYFFKSFLVTFQYMLYTIPFAVILAVVVGAVLTSKIKGEKFFKTAFYVPSVTVGVAVSAMWMFMLDPTYGMINQLLGTNVNFLGTKGLAMITLAVMSIWGGLGYNTLIMVSAMKNIDPTLYEAAEIDGANAVNKFFKITIPSVMPTIFFIIITSVIGSFQVFDQIYLMTGGGPEHSTYTYMFGVFAQAFDYDNHGTASAMSYILFFVILIITFIQFKVLPQNTDDTKKRKRRVKNAV